MRKAIVVIVSQLEHRAVFGLLHPLPVQYLSSHCTL